MNAPERLRLLVITDPAVAPGRTLLQVVEAALAGGATAIQLRDKQASAAELVVQARALREATRATGALLFVNDRLDVALAAGADGVHLGDDDLPLDAARRVAPPGFLIGVSADTPEGALAAAAASADYVGVGPVFGTASKADAGAAVGVARIAAVARASPVPVLGIGGITAQNAASVMAAGARGVAVIAAVMRDPDPEAAARRLARAAGG